MGEIIELDDVDSLGTGAVGTPGKRASLRRAFERPCEPRRSTAGTAS